MEKGFDIRNYDLFDILNMLKLPYEFQTQHLADLKKKINMLNQPNISMETYNFYKKSFVIVSCTATMSAFGMATSWTLSLRRLPTSLLPSGFISTKFSLLSNGSTLLPNKNNPLIRAIILNDFSFELPLFGSALRAALEDPSMSPIYPFR